MSRLGAFLAACALTLAVLIGASHFASADDRADQLAAQAGQLMFADPPQYEQAIDLYKQAIVLSPEGKFYFNLCVAYYSIGEFGLALQSCDAVSAAGSDAKLNDKTAKLLTRVEDQIRAMGKDPDALRRGENGGGGGTDTGSDTGSGTGTGTDDGSGGGGGEGSGSGGGTGQPVDTNQFKGTAPPSLFTAVPPSHDYVWSLGGELYGFGGKFGSQGNYAQGRAGFRVHADYIVSKARRIGLQGYLGFNSVGKGTTGFAPDDLSIVEFGLAAYSHVWCSGHLCVTPLLGAEIAGYQPAMIMDNQVRFVSVGVRGEVGLSYALGAGYEHVISFNPGFTFYTPTVGDYNGATPADYDLDGSNNAIYFGIGYTHRFNTPFGQAPFITLEN